jgi:hypothetical protein
MTAAYFYFLRGYLAGDKKCIWLLGAVIPLLLYAKYHGVLLIFFTILAVPRLLLRKDFWLVTLISVILFLPHIWWQYQNNFATLRYHFLERPSSDFSLKRVFDYLGTQLVLTGLFCGPIVWWQLKKIKARESFLRVLVFVSWGILIFFLVSNFGVWAVSGMYGKSIFDLLMCYVAGLPFLGNTIVGDLFFSAVMFGSYEWVMRQKVAPQAV